MGNHKIGVAVLGCGGRSKHVVGNLLNDSGRNVKVLSVFDPIPSAMECNIKSWNEENVKRCTSAEEAVYTPGVEWVMIFSPNVFHKEQILLGFSAGKHVFSEKPLATTIEDCQAVFDAHRKSDRLFATGFVLRYAPLYRKVRELIDSGKFGQLLSIEANENITPGHGGYIMRNWRRKSEIAGPHILEKCCHDLDLINWFTGSLPEQVFFTGTTNVFKSANRSMEEKYGAALFNAAGGHDQIESAFNDDSDMMDTSMGVAVMRNGVQVSFCATMCNAIPERRMRFNFSGGTIKIELYTALLEYRFIGNEESHVINYGDVGGHGGGDDFIMKELYETMSKGTLPRCSGNEGLESAVFALAFDQSAREGRIIELKEVWEKLGR